MFTYILYALAIVGLAVSFFKDRKKTKAALMKAWKAFENILPQLLTVFLILAFALAIFKPETIQTLLGSESGVLGILGAALIGSVTLMPGFVAFPLAAALLKSGAGYMQLAAFVSTLMMVGIITIPVEKKTFGMKATIARNASAFVFSLVVAVVMGVALG
ncbi:MAG: permease [Firmicutes bacterium HGW-Firmicutes-9]|nr:MAG: permease [Firmicutes bacterium HGW-Firmicutes-9]